VSTEVVGETREAQVIPSLDVLRVPLSPAATNNPSAKVRLWKNALVAVVAGVQAIASGEVIITPFPPAAT
jgi:hypothetical protein